MTDELETRKAEEAEFHDRLRGLYEKDPELYAQYTSNQRFYSVTQSSSDYYLDWVRTNAAGKVVLDFGCGSGQLSVAAAAVAKSVTGIDISKEAVRLASDRARSAGWAESTSFQVMDAEAMRFEDRSFDLVISSGVLHHMDLDKALAEIARVLKNDGKAIMLEALSDNPIFQLYRRRTPHLRTAWEVDHLLSGSSATFMQEHFEETSVRFFHLLVLLAVPLRNTRLFGPLRRMLDVCDRILLAVPGLRRQAWMACFTVARPRR